MSCECNTKIQLVGNATAGNSITNPFTAEWLYAKNKEQDWGCVTTEDGITFDISTTIEIGDGISPTYFKDTGKTFRFVAPHSFTLNPPAYLELTGGADWTAYEKQQIRDAIGIDGEKTVALSGQLQAIKTGLDFVKDIEGGKWKIENNQMIFYKADNVTEIARFNLFKQGVPTEVEPDERVRV